MLLAVCVGPGFLQEKLAGHPGGSIVTVTSTEVLVGTGAQARADTDMFESGRLRPIVDCSGERIETTLACYKQ